MSKLEELIKEFCPNGVEYKRIGDIGRVAMCKRIMKSDTASEGDVPFYKIGTFGKKADAYINRDKYEEYRAKYSYPKKGDILISAAGTIGKTVIFDGEPAYFQDSNIVWLEHDESIVLNKYLYYVYQTNPWNVSTGGTISRLYNDNITNAIIPLPALPVQREIVRILDSFTLYSAELTAELTARCKQYEFYRDKLLHYECYNKIETIGENIEWLKTGLNPRQNFKLNEPEANCFYITGKDIFNNRVNVTERTDKITQNTVLLINKRANLQDNILLFASTGTGTVGRMAVIDRYDFSWNVSETMYCIKPKENRLLVKYLMYFLYSQTARNEFEPKISKGSVPHLKVADLLNVHINLPPIEVQERIVRVLDNFDAICSDLGIGLPAEIEKRQKQYEYYREKLLTFDNSVATILTDRQTDLGFCSMCMGLSMSGWEIFAIRFLLGKVLSG